MLVGALLVVAVALIVTGAVGDRGVIGAPRCAALCWLLLRPG